jgi:hypothetical protein
MESAQEHKETQMLRTITLLIAAGSAAATVAAISSAARTSVASSNLFADVAADGTLLSGGGVSSVAHVGPGQYEVTFSSNVTQCAYVATTVHAFSQAITVFTAGGHSSVNGVYVEVKNQGGGLLDGPFDLVVDCGAAGMRYAVVGYSANLVRSSGATLSTLGVGRYNLTFPAKVSSCAFLASVGDPGNGLVFNPAGVYTGSGPTAKSAYVETKNPGGGLSAGIPFHLAVICPSAANTHVAVVKLNGLPVRGSKLTSSYNASTGEYVVATSAGTAGCAVIGTRGSINKAVPFTPATVESTPGPAVNTTGIEVRQLLFFGGNLLDESFHAAIVC